MKRLSEAELTETIDAARARYQSRREARIDRLSRRAAKKRAEGEARVERAHAMASVIPLGQPILVGHHSEGRDRRYRARIEDNYSKGFEAIKEADELDRRAIAADSSTAISSDDPDAISRLEEKHKALSAERDKWKAINRAVRSKHPKGALLALGITGPLADALLKPDAMGYVGVPPYKLTNRSAELRRITDRIASIKRNQESDGRSETVGDVRIEQADNRVRLFFPEKPSAEVRDALKRSGFRYAPSEGAWQRFAGGSAWYEAKRIAELAS